VHTPTIAYPVYCVVRVLLGFHRYGTESVLELQKDLIAVGGKLERDTSTAFFKFKEKNVPVRMIHVASELLGRNGDVWHHGKLDSRLLDQACDVSDW